jgi:osmotically inducible protein OsmC
MPVRRAEAVWEGVLRSGNGRMKVGSGTFDVPFTFGTRFEEDPGTNPEELIGAAEAGCFSMALSGNLERAGFKAERIHTTADVHLGRTDAGPTIMQIVLTCEATVPGIDETTFQQQAEVTRTGCPVARALKVDLVLNAKLVK